MPISFTTCDYSATGISTSELFKFMSPFVGLQRVTQRSQESHKSTIKYKKFGPFELFEHGYGSTVEIKTVPNNSNYILQILLSGSSDWRIYRQKISLSRGDSFITSPACEYTTVDSSDCQKLIIKIPAFFLHQSAREFGYLLTSDTIHFSPAKDNNTYPDSFNNLLSDILAYKNCEGSEYITTYYCKLIAYTILKNYENNLTLPKKTINTRNTKLQKIHEFVLDNIFEDISIDDLVCHCNVSRKSIYNLFKNELGITPSIYIRQLKLECLHNDLIQDKGFNNITDIALKYGFTNPGRFSSHYREYFGELPSETIRTVRF